MDWEVLNLIAPGFSCIDSVSSRQALGDIEIAIKLVKTELQSPEHPLDQHYKKLHCALHPLDHESNKFKVSKKNDYLFLYH